MDALHEWYHISMVVEITKGIMNECLTDVVYHRWIQEFLVVERILRSILFISGFEDTEKYKALKRWKEKMLVELIKVNFRIKK